MFVSKARAYPNEAPLRRSVLRKRRKEGDKYKEGKSDRNKEEKDRKRKKKREKRKG
jgi:hypothetical protein